MRLSTILEKNEDETKPGTYAGLRFSQDDEDAIIELVKKMGIPNPIKKEEIHLTLLYSRKHVSDYEPAEMTDMWAYPKQFTEFKSRKDGTRILVLEVDSEDATKRHNELMAKHDATYDFPEYKPHITLSYDLEDFMDLDKIKEKYTELLPKEFHISSEYMENLNSDWETK